jgi:periplasmic copper chaperone A
MRCWLGKSMAGAALAFAAGALALPTPASADVTVDPDVSVQGGAPRLTFTVTNGSPGATLDEVVLTMPDSMPIAETYPLSVDDWAPRINWKQLAEPLQGVHSSKVTEAVADITWIAMPGKGVKPGQSAELLITLGPLPVADQVVFSVTEKYDDGTSVVNDVVPAPGASVPRGAAVLRLIPDTISDQNGGGHHGGTATDPQPVANVTDDSSDTGLWLGIAGLLAGLLGGGVIAWLASRRKSVAPAQVAAATPEKIEPQKSDDSVWRYRGDEDADADAPKVRAAAGKTS